MSLVPVSLFPCIFSIHFSSLFNIFIISFWIFFEISYFLLFGVVKPFIISIFSAIFDFFLMCLIEAPFPAFRSAHFCFGFYPWVRLAVGGVLSLVRELGLGILVERGECWPCPSGKGIFWSAIPVCWCFSGFFLLGCLIKVLSDVLADDTRLCGTGVKVLRE